MNNKIDIKPEIMQTSDLLEKVNGKNDYDTIYQIVNELSMQTIEFQKPLLTFCGIPLIYPKSTTAIQGSKGSHKSRFVETILSAFLNKTSKQIAGMDLMPNNYFVILLDTERSIKEQLPYAIQRIKTRAGYLISESIDNFLFTSNIGINRSERLETFKQYLIDKRNAYPDKHFIIAIDILTDLISSFNDVTESLNLTDYLNQLINDFDCSIIGIIHQNPSPTNDGKARGHLGTESINKASCVIQVSKEKTADLISINYLHLRSNKLPDEKIFVRYDEIINGLEIVDNETVPEYLHAEQKQFISGLLEILKDGNSKSQTEIVNELKPLCNLSRNTIIDKLKHLINGKYNGYIIKATKSGKSVLYHLENVDNENNF
ncbi:MAG: hypothetical protein RO257_08455 [Candidatus Kapabacteria bacterium]|nr:hypothetical protein [Candidatus Kapabacteria bacterium]